MPSQSPAAAAPGGGAADMFLHIQTKRAGKIKGESTVPNHVDDIVVLGWQWGLSSSSALGSSQATGRRAYTALTIHKQIDCATTGLMAALATNDEVKEAKLTLRRAGGAQDVYFSILLKSARVSSVQHVGGESGDAQETLQLVFTQVEVEYRPQQRSGLRGGGYVFTDELMPS
jgi:type VI secretion system secreted protein Hcp